MIDTNFNEGSNERDLDWFEEEYKKSFIDLNEEPERPKPIISIGKYEDKGKFYDNPVFTAGEFSCISAPSKTYKSFFKSHLAAIFNSGKSEHFKDIKGSKNEGDVCIDIDTEQGKYYAWRTFKRVADMSGNKTQGYYPFKLRHLTPEERVDFIDAMLDSNKIRGNIKVVFVDGIADLVTDTNDLEMSQRIASKVMKWTDEYNMHVCVIIHNTYNSIKPTGHLGSTVVKKAETVINLEPMTLNEEFTGVIKVLHQYSRNSPFDSFYFKYDKNLGHLIECDEVGNLDSDITKQQNHEYNNNLDVLNKRINLDEDIPF